MLNSIDEAILDLKNSKMVIVVDDEDRENEGDFIMPAQHITDADVNFMITHGRGLVCAPITSEMAKNIELTPMISKSQDSMQTAFTISVDAREKITTGISSHDRALTLRLLGDKTTTSQDFVKPGHIFPLIAKDNGVLAREGHTEAAVDLARLANFSPVGVICEILKENGEAARLPDLKKLADKFDLKIISIADLVTYRTNLNIHLGDKNEKLERELNAR